MIHTDGKPTIANAGTLMIPGQLDLVTELEKLLRPLTPEEVAYLESADGLAESA